MVGVFPEKKSSFHSSEVSFQKRFSLADHLNVLTTNINTYFSYLQAKNRHYNCHHKALLRCARVC